MKNFFKGLSLTQVLAGSLAAVTSFLLAAKIGIAGSVIGVAVGSIVSTVASQIYQNVIRASSKKIQSSNESYAERYASQQAEESVSDISHDLQVTMITNGGSLMHDDCDNTESLLYAAQGGEDKSLARLTNASAPADSRKSRTVSSHIAEPALAHTSVMELSSLRSQLEEDNRLSQGNYMVSDNGHSHHMYSAVRRVGSVERHYQRLVIMVAVVSAIVAVLLTAAFVLFFTQGKGTDHIPINQPSSSHSTQQPNPVRRQQPNPDRQEEKPEETGNMQDENKYEKQDGENEMEHSGDANVMHERGEEDSKPFLDNNIGKTPEQSGNTGTNVETPSTISPEKNGSQPGSESAEH